MIPDPPKNLAWTYIINKLLPTTIFHCLLLQR